MRKNRYICRMKTKQVYIQKSKAFVVDGNEHIDILLYALESNGVLSKEFKEKITNIIVVILHNSKESSNFIENKIDSLKENMSWVRIFSENFINFVYYNLTKGFEFELDK